MNGCTIPYTPIAVDFWKVRQCQRVRLFFLSHVHLDQTCGITSSWSQPIYCSPISKKLLLQRFQLNQDVVHALELNVRHVIPLSSNGDTMAVTLVDANHCPGSVMFLFEGYFGRILYTGDFRFSDAMVGSSPFCDVVSHPIDVLYMDNTYCSPKCVFPVRDTTQKEILDVVERHPTEKIVIGLRNLGKEDLLVAVATRFATTMKVSEERYRTLELLGAHERFTIDAECRIEVVPMMQITRQNMDAWNRERPTIAILPTALFTALGYLPFAGQKDVFVVPYSDHSSYVELHRFVSAVRPKSVIPIVKADVRDPLTAALLDRTNVECFIEYLDKTSMTNYHIPSAVLELMNQTPTRGGGGASSNCKARKNDRNSKVKAVGGVARAGKVNSAVARTSTRVATTAARVTPVAEKEVCVTEECLRRSEKPKDVEEEQAAAPSGANDVVKDLKVCQTTTKRTSDIVTYALKSLKRCASSDHLHSSSSFRPFHHHPPKQLRSANRVASSDSVAHARWKAGGGIDLKRLYFDRFHQHHHSNLVRTRRVRLCSNHLCKTLCHGSKNCHGGASASDRLLEVNRGEETRYLFTDDVLNRFRSVIQKTIPESSSSFEDVRKRCVDKSIVDSVASTNDVAYSSTHSSAPTRFVCSGNETTSSSSVVNSSVFNKFSGLSTFSSPYLVLTTAPSDGFVNENRLRQSMSSFSGNVISARKAENETTAESCDSESTMRRVSPSQVTYGNLEIGDCDGSGGPFFRVVDDAATTGNQMLTTVDVDCRFLLPSSTATEKTDDVDVDDRCRMSMAIVENVVADDDDQPEDLSTGHRHKRTNENFSDDKKFTTNGRIELSFDDRFHDVRHSRIVATSSVACCPSRRKIATVLLSNATSTLTAKWKSLSDVENVTTRFHTTSMTTTRETRSADARTLADVTVKNRSSVATEIFVATGDVKVTPGDSECSEMRDLKTGVVSVKDKFCKKVSPNCVGGAGTKMALHTTNPMPEDWRLPPKKHWRRRFKMAQLHKGGVAGVGGGGHQENLKHRSKTELNGNSKFLNSVGTNSRT